MNTMTFRAARQCACFFVLASTLGPVLSQSTTAGRGALTSTTSAANRLTTRDVCELNNSCTTPSAAKATASEKPAELRETDKWRYNVSGAPENETAGVFHLERDTNGSTVGLSIDFDVVKNVDSNRSTSSNESRPVVMKYYIEPEENCFCDITVRVEGEDRWIVTTFPSSKNVESESVYPYPS